MMTTPNPTTSSTQAAAAPPRNRTDDDDKKDTKKNQNDEEAASALPVVAVEAIPRPIALYSTDAERPTNTLVTPLLTDLYQITMTYSYWLNGRQNVPSIFELFFRKNPFPNGEYTIIAGVDECIKYINTFAFTQDDIDYLQTIPALQYCQPRFFTDYLLSLTTQTTPDMTVRAIPDGTVVFPRIPLLILEAPLGLGQLLETTLLSLMNYPTLIATNATRMTYAAAMSSRSSHHHDLDTSQRRSLLMSAASSSSSLASQLVVPLPQGGGVTSTSDPLAVVPLPPLPAQCYQIPKCVELGLRRAQGPDGGFSASKYSAIGGCIGTSNVMAGKLCHIPLIGTHAHSYVQSYTQLQEVQSNTLRRNPPLHSSTPDDDENTTTNTTTTTNNNTEEKEILLLPLVLEYRQTMSERYNNTAYITTNSGELAAFIAYATSFPHSFTCLIDTYDTLHSGLLNFIVVAFVLHDLGYVPKGIRLDSGDLAYLSMECALLFQQLAMSEPHRATFLQGLQIIASNDINEDVLHALNKQEHAITLYGIGTNLVTCQAQPALGGVYKLVEIDHQPRIKLSQDISKVLIPGRKKAYRLTGRDGKLLLDVMLLHDEAPPRVGERIICRHPFIERKRAAVTPSKVEELHVIVYQNGSIIPHANRTYEEAIQIVPQQLATVRNDILRYSNPTPYKVSVSEDLFTFLHNLWQAETPVAELS